MVQVDARNKIHVPSTHGMHYVQPGLMHQQRLATEEFRLIR
jgi:hypothetical protein